MVLRHSGRSEQAPSSEYLFPGLRAGYFILCSLQSGAPPIQGAGRRLGNHRCPQAPPANGAPWPQTQHTQSVPLSATFPVQLSWQRPPLPPLRTGPEGAQEGGRHSDTREPRGADWGAPGREPSQRVQPLSSSRGGWTLPAPLSPVNHHPVRAADLPK